MRNYRLLIIIGASVVSFLSDLLPAIAAPNLTYKGLLQDPCKNRQDDPQSIMQKQFEDLCFLLNPAIPNVLTLQSFQINDYSD